jgi:hypothetical protein
MHAVADHDSFKALGSIGIAMNIQNDDRPFGVVQLEGSGRCAMPRLTARKPNATASHGTARLDLYCSPPT